MVFSALLAAGHVSAQDDRRPVIEEVVVTAQKRAENIRDVTLFPMNQQARDLMMGAPSPVDDKQLKELNIRLAPQMKS